MAKADYRVIYNYDSGPVFFQDEPVTPEHVDREVDEVADAGADVMLICTGGQLTCFPSRTWQNYWDGFDPDDRSFFGDTPEDWIPHRIDWIKQMQRLAEECDCDYLERALARCRERGLAPGVTMRMNDMHDGVWPMSHLHSRFYKENPQFHIPRIECRGYGREALDYSHPEVRDHAMLLIRELVECYDFDVLELDFMRFAFYFDRFNVDEHCETSTAFLREVRDLLAASGRDITLIPRVASSPGAARQLGFDVGAWAREGLVDGITPAMFLNTGWELPIGEFRELIGPDVALYAGLDCSACHWDGLPTELIAGDPELLRGFTLGNHVQGVDGINIFNFFCARSTKPPVAPCFSTLAELHAPAGLRAVPRRHLITGGFEAVECDLPSQVPISIQENLSRRFEMVLAAEDEGTTATARVFFDGEAEPANLWLRIGVHSVGHAAEIIPGPEGEEGKTRGDPRKSRIAVFPLPPGVIRDGTNELVLRCEFAEITVLGLDVCVR